MSVQRLSDLRKLMKKNKIDAYLIPSTDPHQSEYVPALWQRRAWFSGFDGSAGDVLVTADKACLWTDSRYFLQAEEQLQGSGIDLFKMGQPGVPTLIAFLKENLKEDEQVGVDPRLLSKSEAENPHVELASKNIKLIYAEENLVDLLWQEQPDLPEAPVFIWDIKYAGESAEGKLQRIRQKMETEGA